MNCEVNIDNKKKRLKLYYGLLITVMCIIGVSFAWFRLYLSQTENNTLASRTCFNTTLTEDTSKISLTDAFPISDEDGLKQSPFTFTLKNNCNSYVKVYITIDSTYRESTSASYLKDNYMKVNISPKSATTNQSLILGNQTLTDLENNRKGYIILSAGLNANEEKSYDLRIWMNSSTTIEQGLNKNWAGKIVVVSNASNQPLAPNGWYEAAEGTLLASLRKNIEISDPITIPGAEPSAYTFDDALTNMSSVISSTDQKYYITYGTGWEANGTKFNLTGTAVTSDTYANSYSSLVGKYLVSKYASSAGSATAGSMKTTTNLHSVYYVVSATSSSFTYKELTSNKNTTEALLASTEDDYGTSYYFRGAVKNNYVQFANKCWRIVRVNGDGSVKLVLHNDNTSGVSNPCASVNNSDTAAFARYNTQYTNSRSYTSTFNDISGDNAYIGFMYGTAGSNDYSSTHANTNKSTILTNLETWYTNNLAPYENKIVDTVWCNDKNVVTDTTFDPFGITPTGLGYGTNSTYYGSELRLSDPKDGYSGGTGPSLKCNGKLSKITTKIGLLSADELAYAGYAAILYSPTTYLQENATGYWWWSLSPNCFNDFNDGLAFVWRVSLDHLDGDGVVDDCGGVRPSISLVSDTKISGGTGTSEDPYVVN